MIVRYVDDGMVEWVIEMVWLEMYTNLMGKKFDG